RFGNPVALRERTAGADAALGVDGLWRDVKYALRQMKKAPGFAAVVIVTLALGIGANTTVFSVVDAVMLRPLPYAQPQRLVEVLGQSSRNRFEREDVSYPDYFDWREQNRSFSQLVSYHDTSFALTGVERAVHVEAEVVSWNLLPLLGVEPELGRGFLPDEEKRGSRVVLISHALWVTQFAGDRSIIGRTIQLSGNAYTVVGVMPASFRFPVSAPQNGIWTTLAMDNDPSNHNPGVANRGMHWLNVMGRLRPGVSLQQASDDMNAIAARLAKQYPNTNSAKTAVHLESAITAVLGDTAPLLTIVLGAVGLVLLIACGNIANLLLARVREREREMAMRAALGAGRSRIVRQLLAESAVLGVAGGAAGCALAFLAVPAVLRLIGDSIPRAADAGVNLPVLAFALVISLLAALLFGLLPAWTATRLDPITTLKEGGRAQVSGHDWLRSAVIVGQVALGIVLASGAGLLLSSYARMAHANEGFNADHLLTFNFETPDARYAKTRPQFYREYFARLRALPGVESAAGSMFLPMSGNAANMSFEDPQHPRPPGQHDTAAIDVISTDFFHTMQIPILQGRDFTDADDTRAPQVIIVNQAFAHRYLAGETVLGRKIRPGGSSDANGKPTFPQVVGVVGDTRRDSTQFAMQPAIYLPAAQASTWCCLVSVVRTSVDPMSLEPAVRHLVASLDPQIPVTDVHTMRDLIALEMNLPRFAMVLLGAFAALALLLAIVGLYGVMTYSVTRRTRDIGVRLALGAQRSAVLRMILRDAALLVGIGMAVGMVATVAATSLLRAILFATGPRDPLVLGAVCAVMIFAGLLAAYLPAMRAAGIDPMRALRAE
ncbi:MAG TPA: ABC transporter permease, partial [Acidobacteriaceae bacterium]|nr:ABC transporter permease [Acidobacteriaceae bacterium]